MEGQHFRKTGKLVSLSESNLVDCSGAWGNGGCDGGRMDHAFQYVIDNHGIDTEASYPYTPSDGPCRFKNDSSVGATFRTYVNVKSGNENALKEAVARFGPISVAITATKHFEFYTHGVLDDPTCSGKPLNHGVLVVGYGTTPNGTDYWQVKNSWGIGHGNKGYYMMSRNKGNQCGIASMASYPVV